MTVAELIEVLQQHDQNAVVNIAFPDSGSPDLIGLFNNFRICASKSSIHNAIVIEWEDWHSVNHKEVAAYMSRD